MSLLKLNEHRLLFYNLCNLQLSGLLGVWWAPVRVGVMWAWRLLLSLHLKYSWRCESRGNRGAVNKSHPGLIIALTRARAHTHSHTRTGPHRGKSESPHLQLFFPFLMKMLIHFFYSGFHYFLKGCCVGLAGGTWTLVCPIKLDRQVDEFSTSTHPSLPLTLSGCT